MACIGTLDWAINEIEDVKRSFSRYKTKADYRQCSVRELAGKENLATLVDRLDEVLEVLADSRDRKAKKQYEAASTLYDNIQTAMYYG